MMSRVCSNGKDVEISWSVSENLLLQFVPWLSQSDQSDFSIGGRYFS